MQGNRRNTEIQEEPDGPISPPSRGLGGEFPEAENRGFWGYKQGRIRVWADLDLDGVRIALGFD